MPESYRRPTAKMMAAVRRYLAENLCDPADLTPEETGVRPQLRHGARDGRAAQNVRARDGGDGVADAVRAIPDALNDIFSRLKHRIDRTDETFSACLLRLIEERGMTEVEAYRCAGLDRTFFSKICTDQDFCPKSRVVYAFIFVLRLDLDEAQDLLARAGFTISPARPYDLVMEFCIMEGYDIATVNGILYEMGMDVL